MGYVVKGVCILFILIHQVERGVVDLEMMGLLVLSAFYVYQEKYNNHLVAIGLQAVMVVTLAWQNPIHLILFGVTAFDLSTRKKYWWVIPLVPAGFLLSGETVMAYITMLCLTPISGHLAGVLQRRTVSFQAVYDRERQIRYSLEEAKKLWALPGRLHI